jgi:hypothetical protein
VALAASLPLLVPRLYMPRWHLISLGEAVEGWLAGTGPCRRGYPGTIRWARARVMTCAVTLDADCPPWLASPPA